MVVMLVHSLREAGCNPYGEEDVGIVSCLTHYRFVEQVS